MSKTIAYMSDAHPGDYPNDGITKLTEDLNRIVANSPSGTVDLIIFAGDMVTVADTKAALAASNVSTIPTLYTMSNHHAKNLVDLDAIKSANDVLLTQLSIKPGPLGSARSTFSFDLDDTHVVVLNEYWNGESGGGCPAPWFIPDGGQNKDDACFKYSTSDGGYIPDALYTWLEADLTATTKPYKIVIGHEPLYPDENHIGNSLDKDPVNRDKLQQLLVSKGVSTFVSGHTHVASLDLHDSVYHTSAGVSGRQVGEGKADKFSTITYTEDTPTGLVITQKSGTPDWVTPKITTFTVPPSTSTGGKYKCVNGVCTRDDLLGTFLEPTCGGTCIPTPTGDGCNCNCNCNCGGTTDVPTKKGIVLENIPTPQKIKVEGMTVSVYDALMKAVSCTDPLTCTKNVVVWKENILSPLGWDTGDTTQPKTAWTEAMTKVPGDNGEYTFYNDTGSVITIDDMPAESQNGLSNNSKILIGIGLLGLAYYIFKPKNKSPQV